MLGHQGNSADLDCECTILIKDHDVLLPDFASFPTLTNNLVSIFFFKLQLNRSSLTLECWTRR